MIRWRKRFTAALMLLLFAVYPLQSRALGPGTMLRPVGRAVAIRLETDGVLIAGLASVKTAEGECSPAKDAGLRPGDRITGIDGKKISTREDFLAETSAISGEVISIRADRDGEEREYAVQPVMGLSGAWYLGLWLRDGIAGIGTVTFQDPESGLFGALGHGVNADGGERLTPITGGVIGAAEINEARRGSCGRPGELIGSQMGEMTLGTVEKNTKAGIFGEASELNGEQALPAAGEDEITLGAATILSTVGPGEPREYSVEITRISRGLEDVRQIALTVTDPILLERTGGIVQGMSGSPILQNGKLIGAVTHVLVEDPMRGYGVTIERMLEECRDTAAA